MQRLEAIWPGLYLVTTRAMMYLPPTSLESDPFLLRRSSLSSHPSQDAEINAHHEQQVHSQLMQ